MGNPGGQIRWRRPGSDDPLLSALSHSPLRSALLSHHDNGGGNCGTETACGSAEATTSTARGWARRRRVRANRVGPRRCPREAKDEGKDGVAILSSYDKTKVVLCYINSFVATIKFGVLGALWTFFTSISQLQSFMDAIIFLWPVGTRLLAAKIS
uniref:Uncharacterized protein n=1 Tax=Leersia perrieri TaxID=77586 RepID=A0A0D9WY23_9ORYZ